MGLGDYTIHFLFLKQIFIKLILMGKSGSKVLIFKELGIEPDREKIDYYILLDELF